MRGKEPLYGWMNGKPPTPLRPTPPLDGLLRKRAKRPPGAGVVLPLKKPAIRSRMCLEPDSAAAEQTRFDGGEGAPPAKAAPVRFDAAGQSRPTPAAARRRPSARSRSACAAVRLGDGVMNALLVFGAAVALWSF